MPSHLALYTTTLRITTCHSMPLPAEVLFLSNSVHKRGKKCLLLQMHRYLHKVREIMKNQGNMTPPKEYSNLSVTDQRSGHI